MRAVISLVRGQVEDDRVGSLVGAYRAATADGLPAGILATYALRSGLGEVAILTIWRSRDDLDEMLASGQEPLARRLIREAGGEPRVEVLDVLTTAP